MKSDSIIPKLLIQIEDLGQAVFWEKQRIQNLKTLSLLTVELCATYVRVYIRNVGQV
jgi:hypothetical protein